MITMKTLAFDVETLEVGMNDEGLFPVHMNSFDNWLVLLNTSQQTIEIIIIG